MQKPNKKVASGGLAGGITALILWGMREAGVEVTAELGAAIATIVAFTVSYFVPESASTKEVV